MYVLRFAQRDYYSYYCHVGNLSGFSNPDNAVYVDATAFDDFDIITLTFTIGETLVRLT